MIPILRPWLVPVMLVVGIAGDLLPSSLALRVPALAVLGVALVASSIAVPRRAGRVGATRRRGPQV